MAMKICTSSFSPAKAFAKALTSTTFCAAKANHDLISLSNFVSFTRSTTVCWREQEVETTSLSVNHKKYQQISAHNINFLKQKRGITINNITFPNNSLKRLEGTERGSKIISPNIPPINNSGKEILAGREACTFDEFKCLGATDKIKSETRDAIQRGDGPEMGKV